MFCACKIAPTQNTKQGFRFAGIVKHLSSFFAGKVMICLTLLLVGQAAWLFCRVAFFLVCSFALCVVCAGRIRCLLACMRFIQDFCCRNAAVKRLTTLTSCPHSIHTAWASPHAQPRTHACTARSATPTMEKDTQMMPGKPDLGCAGHIQGRDLACPTQLTLMHPPLSSSPLLHRLQPPETPSTHQQCGYHALVPWPFSRLRPLP